jgi:hypothetical protein
MSGIRPTDHETIECLLGQAMPLWLTWGHEPGAAQDRAASQHSTDFMALPR